MLTIKYIKKNILNHTLKEKVLNLKQISLI